MYYMIYIILFFVLCSISITNEFEFNKFSKLDILFSNFNTNESKLSEISIIINPLIKLLNDTFYEIINNNTINISNNNSTDINNNTDINNSTNPNNKRYNISQDCANTFNKTFFSSNITISKAYLQRFLNFTSTSTNDVSSFDECIKGNFKDLEINTSYIVIKYYRRIESRFSAQMIFYFPDNGIRGFCFPSGCSDEEYNNIIINLHEKRKEIMPISFELYNYTMYPTKSFVIAKNDSDINILQKIFNYLVVIITSIQIFICFFPLSLFYLSFYFIKFFCYCFTKKIKKTAFKKKFLGYKKCYSISENLNKLNSQNINDEGLNFIKGIRGLNMLFYSIGMVIIIILHSPSKFDCPEVIREVFTNYFYSIFFYSIKYAPIFLLSCSGASLSYKFLNFLDEKVKQQDFDENRRSSSVDNLGLLQTNKKDENYSSVKIGLLIRFISYQIAKYIIFVLTLLFNRYTLFYFTSFFKDQNPTWKYFKFFLTEKISFWKIISNALLFPSFNFIHEKNEYYEPIFNIIFDYYWLVFNEIILFLIGIIIIFICIKKEYQIMTFTYIISALCIIFRLILYIIKINELESNGHYAPYILTYSYYGKIVINPLSNLGVYFIGICFGIYLYTFQKELTPKKAGEQGKAFLHKINYNLLNVLKSKRKNTYYIISYFLLPLVLIFCITQRFLNFDIVHDQNGNYREEKEKKNLYNKLNIFNYFFIIENEIIVFLTFKSIFYLSIIMNSEFLSFLKSDFWRIINKIYFSYIIVVIPLILFFVYHSNTKILFNFTNITFYSLIISFISFLGAFFYLLIYEMPLKNLIRAIYRRKDKKNIRKNLEEIKNDDLENKSIFNKSDSIQY